MESRDRWLEGATGANRVEIGREVQSLWSGYGTILKVDLDGRPAILKEVIPPSGRSHPRGWGGERGHKRKLRSYDVEMTFYRDYAQKCDTRCRTARALALGGGNGAWRFLLEDLDASGYAVRKLNVDSGDMRACLEWLARFHATFLGCPPEGLWKVGTYWHLGTRPDEYKVMKTGPLKAHAGKIDARLNQCRFKTLVHGDAKVANFCFSEPPNGVAAVDFQYVGAGCGIKDVVYFFSSTLSSADCEREAEQHLDAYFEALRSNIDDLGQEVDAEALEAEWRALYPLAWADFERFLAGWAPDHYKRNAYSETQTRRALEQLGA